ncbi:hypothetical protein NL676_015600 [Syzygium grande]|nr:hypothetical protein NL676_015600 [Syzygium grande]
MGEVDPAFIQDVEHRPKPAAAQAEGIPLVDLAAVTGYSPSDGVVTASAAVKGLVAEIGEACKKWGFFAVVNHGMAAEKRERIEREAREFFGQGLEEKKKEVFDFTVQEPMLVPASHEDGEEGVIEWTNRWPEYPPGLRLMFPLYVFDFGYVVFQWKLAHDR